MTKRTEALKLIADIASGSTTANSLQNIAKIAQEALAQPEPEQEPVAVYGYCPECGAEGVARERRPDGNDCCANGHTYPSRTANKTPQCKPLTDEQILSVARDHYNPHQRPEISFARAIEAAHGINEKNT